MIVCPACSYRNPEGTTLCQACQHSLEAFVYRACPACGALNSARDLFCRRCLEELAPVEQDKGTLVEGGDAPGSASEPSASLARGPRADVADRAEDAPAQPGRIAEPETRADDQGVLILHTAESGPLEGLDLLPVEPAICEPHRAGLPAIQQPGVDQEQAAGLFQRMATEGLPQPEVARVAEVVPQLQARPPAPVTWSRLRRLTITLLVLLAALAPLWTHGWLTSQIHPREAVVAWARDLASIPSGSTVLVSFDYTPAYAGELNPMATDLARQLAARSVRLLAMSTKPSGIGLATQTYAALARQTPGYRYGEDFACLGYLPGQEVGLRLLNESFIHAFAMDAAQMDSLKSVSTIWGVSSVQDVQCVIVLSDDGDSIRRWIEQVQSRSGVTLDALVPAAIEPLLMPYHQTGQLRNLLAGATTQAESETISNSQPLYARLAVSYPIVGGLVLLVAVATNIMELRHWFIRRKLVARDLPGSSSSSPLDT